MPDRRVALIRGINVGRAKRIAMADLRKLVEKLGCTDVRTLLNSGNVVFTAPSRGRRDLAALIEESMTAQLGVSARVIVLTAAEVDAAIEENPLLGVAKDPSRLLVMALRKATDRTRLEPLTRKKWTPEAFALGKRVAYFWCPDGIIKSRVAEAVNDALGDAGTARNWATMLKIQALLGKE